jgi:hypothetical protein
MSEDQKHIIEIEDETLVVRQPNTLSEFHRIWDIFESPIVITYIISTAQYIDGRLHFTSIHGNEPSHNFDKEPITSINQDPQYTRKITFNVSRKEGITSEGPTINTFYLQGHASERPYADNDLIDADWDIKWRVLAKQQEVKLQQIMSEAFGIVWRKGKFSESFNELQKITSDYQDLSFDKVNAVLSSEASRSAKIRDTWSKAAHLLT